MPLLGTRERFVQWSRTLQNDLNWYFFVIQCISYGDMEFLKINTYSVFLLYNYKTLLPLPLPPSSALVFDTHGQLRLVQGYCSPTVRSS